MSCISATRLEGKRQWLIDPQHRGLTPPVKILEGPMEALQHGFTEIPQKQNGPKRQRRQPVPVFSAL